MPITTRKACGLVSGNGHTCVNCLKKEDSLLEGLSNRELKILDSRRHLIHVKRGKPIFEKGMENLGLLALSRGKAKVIREMANGSEQIIALRKPVDFIGFRSLIQKRNYVSTAIALEDVEVCVIHKDDFFTIVKNNASLAMKIMDMLTKELDEADKLTEIHTSRHLRGRLAEALLRVQDFYGTLPEEENRLNVLLKRSDLASLSNMNTANVIRTLAGFAKDGLIQSNLRKIWIKDQQGLSAIAFGSDAKIEIT